MNNIQLSDKQPLAGPLSKDQLSIVQLLKTSESCDVSQLRERVSLIRSKFWKAVLDLASLEVLKISMD